MLIMMAGHFKRIEQIKINLMKIFFPLNLVARLGWAVAWKVHKSIYKIKSVSSR